MEYVKGAVGFGDDQKDNQSGGQSSSGMLGGKSDKVSSVSGGGDNGDSQGYLDKGGLLTIELSKDHFVRQLPNEAVLPRYNRTATVGNGNGEPEQ